MYKEDMKRNKSIDGFRLICAIMIVAIHTKPFFEINENIGYIVSNIIPRIAVPFFFCTSGYYYIYKLKSNKKPFKSTMIKLLQVYTIWSIIYFSKDLLKTFLERENVFIWIVECVKKYFIYGSAVHLWYFPALFFCIIVTTVFYKYNKINLLAIISGVCYMIGCLGDAYYSVGSKLFIVGDIINSPYYNLIRSIVLYALPTFICGYFLNKFIDKNREIKVSSIKFGLIVSVILFLSEIFLVLQLNISKSITITLFLYPLLFFTMSYLLVNPMSDRNINTKYCRGIANFIYYSHPLIFPIFLKVFEKIGFIQTMNSLVFIFTIISTYVLGVIIIKIDNKYINKLIF